MHYIQDIFRWVVTVARALWKVYIPYRSPIYPRLPICSWTFSLTTPLRGVVASSFRVQSGPACHTRNHRTDSRGPLCSLFFIA